MSDRVRRNLLRITEDSCRRLFAGYQVGLGPSDGKDRSRIEPFPLYGVVGFYGKGLHGSLLLAASNALLTSSSSVSNVPVRDWLAELTNQLMGRTKNQLRLYGVDIHAAAPLALREQHTADLRARVDVPVSLRARLGLVCFWLDVEIGRSFAMLDEPDPSRAGHHEGDVVIY